MFNKDSSLDFVYTTGMPIGINIYGLNVKALQTVCEVKKQIDTEVKKNEVCLFMKGTPEVPQCGFSLAVSNVLKHLQVNFQGINVLEDTNIREGIKKYSDWPTIPQLYMKGEFIGGCDIVKEIYESGELLELFNSKGIKVDSS